LFERDLKVEASVRTVHDLYFFEHRVSMDGVSWRALDEEFGPAISAGLDTQGASLGIVLEQRP